MQLRLNLPYPMNHQQSLQYKVIISLNVLTNGDYNDSKRIVKNQKYKSVKGKTPPDLHKHLTHNVRLRSDRVATRENPEESGVFATQKEVSVLAHR